MPNIHYYKKKYRNITRLLVSSYRKKESLNDTIEKLRYAKKHCKYNLDRERLKQEKRRKGVGIN